MISDVFISHTPQDRAVADKMCEFLEAQDIKCWIAHRDGSSAGEGSDGISGLEACRAMVLIFSASANDSASIRDEADYAVKAHKVLISFAIEKVLATPEMESSLKHRFAIDAQSRPLEQHLELLARTLKPLTHKLLPKPTLGRTISGTLPAINSYVRTGIPILASKTDLGGLRISFDFNHIVVAGFPSVFRMKVENQGPNALRKIEIKVDSRGLGHPVMQTWAELAPGDAEIHSFEMEPTQAGHFILRVGVKCQDGPRVRALAGSRSLRVNAPPTTELIGRMKKLLGLPDLFEAPPSVGATSSPSLDELLKVELPELFEPIDLALDYELGVEAEARMSSHRLLQIPPESLGVVPSGTILKLEPLGSPGTVPYQEVRLVARSSFGVGRSREESDFVAWFWPRNEVHDVKTRRVSKRHCTLTIGGAEIRIANAATMGNTLLDGEKVPDSEGMPLGKGGALDLSGIYFLEVAHLDSHSMDEPAISNEADWAGARDSGAPTVRGSVRFLPVAPHVLPQNSTWLLTDATFGASRANGVLLELKGLGEVQGRFYYHRGLFWIENFEDNGAVRIGEDNLEPGFIAPLSSGQTVQLGETRYRVTVER